MGTGQTNVKRYIHHLRDLIIEGRASPSFVVSHELPLDQAPQAYEKFDTRGRGLHDGDPAPAGVSYCGDSANSHHRSET
jgi:hypothetical protein